MLIVPGNTKLALEWPEFVNPGLEVGNGVRKLLPMCFSSLLLQTSNDQKNDSPSWRHNSSNRTGVLQTSRPMEYSPFERDQLPRPVLLSTTSPCVTGNSETYVHKVKSSGWGAAHREILGVMFNFHSQSSKMPLWSPLPELCRSKQFRSLSPCFIIKPISSVFVTTKFICSTKTSSASSLATTSSWYLVPGNHSLVHR